MGTMATGFDEERNDNQYLHDVLVSLKSKRFCKFSVGYNQEYVDTKLFDY